MATIELRLSAKVQKETGRSEILIRLFQGSKINLRAKTGVYVSPSHFEFFIDRENTQAKVPANVTTATKEEADKKHWVVYDRGEITVRNRLESPDKTYHTEAKNRVEALKAAILTAFERADKSTLTSEWLKDIIDRHSHPEKYLEPKKQAMPILPLMQEYLSKKGFAHTEEKCVRSMMRTFARFCTFIEMTENRKGMLEDIKSITKDDIDDFRDYIRNEHLLAKEYKEIYKTLLACYPVEITAKHKSPEIQERGINTVIKIMKRLRAFFCWCLKNEIIEETPFKGVEIDDETYGQPVYITLAERDQIANFDLSNRPSLAVQRDVFVLQCHLGCRVSDLTRLTEANINGGILRYIPDKTHKKNPEEAVVPLTQKAKDIIGKYRGIDKRGRLMPFVSDQNYNSSIKEIFRVCGITRNVVVRNPKTGRDEVKPICDLASSHLARRTFVGNLYGKVKDPALIGKMSGHRPDSKSFRRYRKIEDETLIETIAEIEMVENSLK